MNLIKFLTSKTFFINLGLAVLVVIIGVFGVLKFLKVVTQHDIVVKVPNLINTSSLDAAEKLQDLDLHLVILDTIPYNNTIKPFAIVEQDPLPEQDVKNGRKIYVQINAGEYENVKLPVIKEGTSLRQAENLLRSAGLEVGEKTYKRHEYKDVVLGLISKGKPITAGTILKKHSKVDLVLGDGFTKPTEIEVTLNNTQNLINAPETEEIEGFEEE
ncbi:PASTA domain-containing protein [Flavobacterium agricola]|uniref:PASTA domain-containing protein n=1 Tax=Flavobacterium agricola TaxID=2870839 RepID=A0ABY6M2H3_9FLAO|nr:PASTA domain-containing protein [Flavobacterium agricola]UYW01839.1 PASTA domain-containing protein [Flavobacterium agricola]